MVEHTLDEWKAIYEQKTGKTFEPQTGFKLFYYPERGFAEIGIDTNAKMVICYQLCGDGFFWRRLIEFLSVNMGYPVAGTICIRRIVPYIRFWGYKIESKEEVPGATPRYFCKNKEGKWLQCSPAWQDEKTGEFAYWMTWEV